MKTLTIGEFQYEVLLAIREQPSDASVTGLTVRLTTKLNRDVHNGEVTRALRKLRMRHVVEKVAPDETVEKKKGLGGPRRTLYEPTELGTRILVAPHAVESDEMGAGTCPV